MLRLWEIMEVITNEGVYEVKSKDNDGKLCAGGRVKDCTKIFK